MSLSTWKEEFYPTPIPTSTWKEAIEHSLRKWWGLTEANLQKHGCYIIQIRGDSTRPAVTDGKRDMLPIDNRSCAMCKKDEVAGGVCLSCPLYNNGIPCTCSGSAYADFIYHKYDPSRMIAELERLSELELDL